MINRPLPDYVKDCYNENQIQCSLTVLNCIIDIRNKELKEKDKQISELQSIGYLRKCALEIEEKDNRIKELGIKIDKLTNINTELQAEINKWKELTGIKCLGCKRK